MAAAAHSFLFMTLLLSSVLSSGHRLDLGYLDQKQEVAHLSERVKKILDIDCKHDILHAFGIPTDRNRGKAFIADFPELEYCRRNKFSCCTGAEFEAMIPAYYRAHRQMQKLLEPIEELTTLFKGPKFSEEVLEKVTANRVEKNNCQKWTVLPKDGETMVFSTEFQATRMVMGDVLTLLSELDFFVKRQGWFFGNLMCTICNPEDQEYLSLKDGKLKITATSSTCNELFDMREWEARLGVVYSKFLRPVANTYKCAMRKEGESFDDKDYLPELDIAKLEAELKMFHICNGEFSIKDPNCTELCKVNPSTFRFSEQILSALNQALQFFFPILTDMDIEEFYAERKREEFRAAPAAAVSFFSMSAYSGENLTVEYEERGVNIFNNHWSKKWQQYEKVLAKAQKE